MLSTANILVFKYNVVSVDHITLKSVSIGLCLNVVCTNKTEKSSQVNVIFSGINYYNQ